MNIKFIILTSVNNIKARDPKSNAESENNRQYIEPARYGDPCPERSQSQAKAENQMGKTGKPFGKTVSQYYRQGYGRQIKRQHIQPVGAVYK